VFSAGQVIVLLHVFLSPAAERKVNQTLDLDLALLYPLSLSVVDRACWLFVDCGLLIVLVVAVLC
jgi:hypothetical protein